MTSKRRRPSPRRSAAVGDRDPEAASRSPEEEARDAAIRLLAIRDRSEAEIRRHLGAFAPEVADAVVARLRDLRYVDDPRFARNLCEQLARRGYGSERARAELVTHDIAHPVVEENVAEMAAGDAERAAALLQRRFGGVPEAAREKVRAARFLYNRGYPGDLVLAMTGQDW